MKDPARCYEILEVEPGASWEEVRRAYRDLAQVWHPDRFENRPDLRAKAESRLQEINEAYRQLSRISQTGRGEREDPATERSAAPEGVGGSEAGVERLNPVRRGWRRAIALGRKFVSGFLRRRDFRWASIVVLAAGTVTALWVAGGGRGFVARGGERVHLAGLSAGGWHACGLDSGGTAYCWGADDARQLGNGEGTDVCGSGSTLPCSLRPRRVLSSAPFESLVAGLDSHVRVDGRRSAVLLGCRLRRSDRPGSSG